MTFSSNDDGEDTVAEMKRTKSLPYSVRIGTCTLRLDIPRIIGILNVTPDSFSGDGIAGDALTAIERGEMMFDSGADIVDVGGESTRPGAAPISEEEEIRRTIEVVEALARRHPGRISIDTHRPRVAESAIYAGATIINDVTGLRDGELRKVVAAHDATAIIMHMKGVPRTMQTRPRYRDVVAEIKAFLNDRIEEAENDGIGSRKIMIDPGIGFGKTLDHNLQILSRLREFRSFGKPIVIGVSRKSFIGKITGLPPEQRLEGSIAAAVMAVRNGADIVRVHDVSETVRALKVAHAIIHAED